MDIGGPNPQPRLHVQRAQDWGSMAGTDYWFYPGGTADWDATKVADYLGNHGWTLAGGPVVAQSGVGDLFSASDPGFNYVALNQANMSILSPDVIGGYAAREACERILGRTPTRLYVDAYLWWATVNQNDVNCYFGVGAAATLYSNGVNWRLDPGGGGAVIVGPAVDAALPHEFRIIFDTTTQTEELVVDGVSYGTTPLRTDLYPVAVYAQCAAIVLNEIEIVRVHAWYD